MADKKIDPRLYLPIVEGYEYEDKSGDHVELSREGEIELTVPLPSANGLQPPGQVTVVDQVFRKGSDGRTVVDLVVEVEDMPGATEYEVRVAAG